MLSVPLYFIAIIYPYDKLNANFDENNIYQISIVWYFAEYMRTLYYALPFSLKGYIVIKINFSGQLKHVKEVEQTLGWKSLEYIINIYSYSYRETKSILFK